MSERRRRSVYRSRFTTVREALVSLVSRSRTSDLESSQMAAMKGSFARKPQFRVLYNKATPCRKRTDLLRLIIPRGQGYSTYKSMLLAREGWEF